MFKGLFVVALLGTAACGSDASDAQANHGGASGSQSCPDVSGTWTVTKHCDASFVGQELTATQTDCALTFAAPFDSFVGSVTNAGAISLSGPQSCNGTASSTAVNMTCTPATCEVVLRR